MSSLGPTPNMLVSFSLTRSPSIETTTYAWIEGFNLSKVIIKSEMTSFISYVDARQITFPCPT
jgi:hypothetical protein